MIVRSLTDTLDWQRLEDWREDSARCSSYRDINRVRLLQGAGGQLLQCSVVFSDPQWGQLTMVILGSLLSDVSDAVSSRLLTSLVTYKGVRYQSILIWVIVWTQNQLLSWTCQAFLPTCLLLLFSPVWVCICVFASVFVYLCVCQPYPCMAPRDGRSDSTTRMRWWLRDIVYPGSLSEDRV